jgi:hypothetical protein
MVAPSTLPPPEDELLDEELELLDELEELLLDELEELEEELLELEDGLPELPVPPPQAINALMVKHKAPCLSSVSGLLPELAIFMRFSPLALVYS